MIAQLPDFPVLNERLDPQTSALPLGASNANFDEGNGYDPPREFLDFFIRAEQTRQRLFEAFNYRIRRRLETYPNGTLGVKYICPPYGNGESGSQPRQITLTITSTGGAAERRLAQQFLIDTLVFFIKKQEMEAVAKSVLDKLTPAQREALRWAAPELLR